MNLMPFANLLEAAGVGIKGKTLFLNLMPAEARQAVMLRVPLRGTPIDYELPGFYHAEFQMIVRAASYPEGEALANLALKALTMLRSRQVENLAITYCRPQTDPVAFPLSDGNLLEFNVQFDICFVKG